MTKGPRCYGCGETDPDKFFKIKGRHGGYSSNCKECRRAEVKRRLAHRKGFVNTLYGGGCSVCGETDIAALEFHHVDPAERSFSAAGHGCRRTWSIHLQEIVKCVVLCANCHNKVHHYGLSVSNLPRFDAEEIDKAFKEYCLTNPLDIS